MSTRRAFMQTSAAALAACGAAAAQNQPRVPVVDAHLHCFAGVSDKRFPYHARAPYRPEEPATPQHLLHCMEGGGGDYAIVVHPEPYQDDHRYLEHCLQIGKGKLKGTCLFFAERDDAATQLANLAKRLPLVAARIHAYAPERLPPFGRRELHDFWKAIASAGLAVQLHFEPRHAPGFEPLIREFGDTKVIIDHLGRPFQGSPQEHAVVVRWSRFKNTIMKLSAIPAERSYPHRDIRPIIRELTDAYGAERMIYGGGFAAQTTPESYRAAREQARGYIAHLRDADQAKILGGTAARLFGFVEDR